MRPTALFASVLGLSLLMLAGCGEREQKSAQPAATAASSEAAKATAPTTRVRAEARPSPTTAVKPEEPMRAATPETTAPAAQPAQASAQPTPPPSPMTEVLAELEKIPVTITDRVTTPQVDMLRAAIVNVGEKYINAGMVTGDRNQAELEEQLEKFDKLAAELLTASSPDELREKYRQLSEGLKLLDAEIRERQQSQRRPGQ